MNATKKRLGCFLLFVGLVLFPLDKTAIADSTATADTDLNLALASFSGAVSPRSTLTEVGGMDLSPNSLFMGGTNSALGWVPLFDTLQLAPQTFAVSTAATQLTALSANAGNFFIFAQTERQGFISSTDGNVDISIPYSFSVSLTTGDPNGPCCDTARTTVFLELFKLVGDQNQFEASTGINYIVPAGSLGNFNKEGVISLSATGLQPGTYLFDAGGASLTMFVPEPSSIIMLGVGLLGIMAKHCCFRKPHTT